MEHLRPAKKRKEKRSEKQEHHDYGLEEYMERRQKMERAARRGFRFHYPTRRAM